jgi:hypothetical protein
VKILGTLSNLQAIAPSYDNQLENWWFHVPLPILTFPFDPGERGHNRGLAFARKAVVRTQLLSGIGALVVKIREAWHQPARARYSGILAAKAELARTGIQSLGKTSIALQAACDKALRGSRVSSGSFRLPDVSQVLGAKGP